MADRKSKSVFFLLSVQILGLNVPVDQDARLILWQRVPLCGAVMFIQIAPLVLICLNAASSG